MKRPARHRVTAALIAWPFALPFAGLGGAADASTDATTAHDAAASDRLAGLPLERDDAPAGALAPLEDILKRISVRTGFAFIFDSRIVENVLAPSTLADEAGRAPESALRAELARLNLALHPIKEGSYAISAITPETEALPAVAHIEAAPDLLEDAIIVLGARSASFAGLGADGVARLDDDFLSTLNAPETARAFYALPQTLASFSSSNTTLFRGAAGVNLADLRGLAPWRTAVLINNRLATPLPAGFGQVSGFDLNAVPEPFLSRIEVDASPAAARVDAGAASGAVNFTYRSNFDGLEAGLRYGASQHGDREERSAHVLFGGQAAAGALDVTVGLAGSDIEGLLNGQRALTAEPFGFSVDGRAGRGPGEAFLPGFGASAVTGAGAVTAVLLANGDLAPLGSISRWNVTPEGSLEPFEGRLDQLYNWAPQTSAILPLKGGHGFLSAVGDIGPGVSIEIFARGGVTETEARLAPTPVSRFRGGDPLTGDAIVIALDNPLLPAAIADAVREAHGADADAAVLDYRFVSAGPRRSFLTRPYVDVSAALSIEAKDGVATARYGFARNGTRTRAQGLINRARLSTATDPVACSQAPACVLFNPFAPGGPTAAATDYIRAPEQVERTSIAEHHASLDWTLDAAPEGRHEARIGASIRRQRLQDVADAAGSEVPPSLGGFGPRASEASLTLVDIHAGGARRFGGDDSRFGAVTFSADARLSVSDAFPAALNFEGAFEWRPVDAVSVFTRHHVGSRPPTIVELFSQDAAIHVGYADPCANLDAGAIDAVAETCRSSGPLGAPAAPEQSTPLARNAFFGNPDLDPEKIRSNVYGVSLRLFGEPEAGRPQAVLGFSWRDYRITDAISAPSSPLLACYSNPAAFACGVNPLTGAPTIQRDPETGSIVSFDTRLGNGGMLNWRGFDAEADVSYSPTGPSPIDRIWLSAFHTYTDRVLFAAPDAAAPSRADGLIDFPRNRTVAAFGAERGPAGLGFIFHRRGGAMGVRPNNDFGNVPSVTTLDATLTFRIGPNAEIGATVGNIFDADPPVVVFGEGTVTSPQYYDLTGRRFAISARAVF